MEAKEGEKWMEEEEEKAGWWSRKSGNPDGGRVEIKGSS